MQSIETEGNLSHCFCSDHDDHISRFSEEQASQSSTGLMPYVVREMEKRLVRGLLFGARV
jgi:hypothetical protein